MDVWGWVAVCMFRAGLSFAWVRSITSLAYKLLIEHSAFVSILGGPTLGRLVTMAAVANDSGIIRVSTSFLNE